MDRRRFLTTLGCSAAAAPLVTPMAFAQVPTDNRLIVIILRGGMDGLDVIRPVGDPDFAALRPDLGSPPGTPLGNGFFALHPAAAPLLPLWDAGELSFAHAVSTPYRDKRSHFDGQDLLEAGTMDFASGIRGGWLNRLVAEMPGATAETVFAIGRERMLLTAGPARVSRWSPDARLRLSPATQALLEYVYREDAIFREASAAAIRIAEDVAQSEAVAEEGAAMEAEMMTEATRGVHAEVARFAADRLRGETRIAAFSLNGWDTHARQHNTLPRALSALSQTILTLKARLGPIWGRTALVAMTEFGRTARQNGTLGTDHGTGGAMVFAGGALRRAQVVADWPGLAEADLYARRDLDPTRDVRAHAGWMMRELFGADRALLERTVFPGVDLGENPGVIG